MVIEFLYTLTSAKGARVRMRGFSSDFEIVSLANCFSAGTVKPTVKNLHFPKLA